MVDSETRAVEADGNDGTTAFPFNYPLQNSAQLVVTSTVTATGVATTLVENTHYTVAPSTYTSGVGYASATVNCVTPPATGTVLRVERTLEFKQSTSFRAQGAFSPERYEAALDRVTFLAQQLKDRVAALEALGSLVPASDYASARVQVQFTTDVSAVEDTFPVTVAMPAGAVVTGCNVIRARNLTSPTDILEEPPQATWEPNGSGLDLLYVSGLSVGTEYLLDLQVLSEAP